MEHILNRVALEHDLPISTVRSAMESAIHEGFENPNGRMKEVFGDREPTVEARRLMSRLTSTTSGSRSATIMGCTDMC